MRNTLKSILVVILVIIITASFAEAQTRMDIVRYNDDFTALKNDSVRKGFDGLKYIVIGQEKYISFGGELREQLQLYNNINFGDVPPNYAYKSAVQLWHRLLLHTNMELDEHFRMFIQTSNTYRFLNENPLAPEIDENALSLHQAFTELNLKKWKFRIGRQELFYGNHRLITVREGPNTRQTFDGLLIKKEQKNGSIDFFAVSKVISQPGVFDDESFRELLIGTYGTRYFAERKVGLDYYSMYFQSKLRKYNYQPGLEQRQTYGLRIFSIFKRLNFEAEAAYQTGRFNDLRIRAYSVLTDVSYKLLSEKNTVLGFTINIASGDRNANDGRLNTYNLIYAKPAFGLGVPIGATNIISLNPYLKITPVPKLNVLAEIFFLSRNSTQDGTYSPLMIENRPRPEMILQSAKKKSGTFYVVEINYQQTKNLSFALDASYFNAGDYPKSTGQGKDILYLSLKSSFRF